MESFIRNSTRMSPYINFISNEDIFLLEITGRSVMEDPIEFYKPLMDFLVKNEEELKSKPFTVNIYLDYFNTISSKEIGGTMFGILDKIHKKSKSVKVNFYFEKDDEDMIPKSDYYGDFEIPFSFPFKCVERE
jgi:hypothetical protein